MVASYAAKKERERAREAAAWRAGRSIGELPWVADPARRRGVRRDFRAFCEVYFGATFTLAFAADHLRVIGQIEASVLSGGLFATAMPRGSGKTTLCECACIWAVLCGHREFVALIGSDEGHAMMMLEGIKTELESNERLKADFPEALVPVWALEGIANRGPGQLYEGTRTKIEWTAKEIVLPSLAPVGWKRRRSHREFVRPDGHSLSAGSIIKVGGLTGGIRGMKHKRPDGATVRPSLVVLDDPQTDESARSPNQCATRERILAGAVLGLAGPGKKIAGIMPCTVIAPGDMADRILDRDRHPDWNGTRTRMVDAFPSDTALWEEYARIRADGLRAEDSGRAATAFYAAHRAAMDAGAAVAWPARFNHDELSAVQHAMNLRLRDERAFFAEYQNEPLPEQEERPDDLSADTIAGKVNRHRRGLVPLGCDRVTAFVDVQADLLYYVVCAWEEGFTGAVIDYGTYPDQKRPYFSLRDAKQTLERLVPAAGLEGRLYGGLEALCGVLLARDWPRDDGTSLRIERCLVDAHWGQSTAVVNRFCRSSAHAGVLTPSHGKYIGASSISMGEWARRPGERVGLNWRLRKMGEGAAAQAVRSVIFDTNFWKSFLRARLATAMGDRGGLSLFGDRPDAHRMFADHLTAEYPERATGRGRTVDEWKRRADRENHWLDGLVGCLVGASMQGVTLAETAVRRPAAGIDAGRPRPRMSDLARQRAQRA